MMDSFDLALMANELVETMEARGLSVDDMKNVARVVSARIEVMQLECDKL